MKRYVSIIVSIVFLLIILSGCGGAASNDSSNKDAKSTSTEKSISSASTTSTNETKEPVVIKQCFAEGEFNNDQIAQFEKENPGIKIERVGTDIVKLMALIAANNAPDILRVSGVNDVPMMASRGLLMPLDSYLANSKVIRLQDMNDIVNIYKWDGQKVGSGSTYGLPKDFSTMSQIWINKKLFAEAGIPIPSTDKRITYTEMFDMSKKLTKITGGKTSQWGFASWMTYDWYNLAGIMVSQMGSSFWSSDFSKPNFSSPEAKKALQYWVDFAKSKAMNSPLNPTPDGWGGSIFMEDKLGIFNAGYWYSGMIRGNDKLKDRLSDFVMLQSPVVEGGADVDTFDATGGAIFKQTKHPEETWKVLEWYMGGSPADERAKSGWGMPLFKSKIDLLPQASDFDKNCLKTSVLSLTKTNTNYAQNPYIGGTGISSLFEKYFVPVLYGKSTLDEACKQIDDECMKLIAEGKDIIGTK